MGEQEFAPDANGNEIYIGTRIIHDGTVHKVVEIENFDDFEWQLTIVNYDGIVKSVMAEEVEIA